MHKKSVAARPKKTPSDSIRSRLEAAVLEVFSGGDFHEADIRTIAKKAGVSFDTIYKYYGSKEQLLFAFVDGWLRELTDRMLDHLQGIEDIKEKLRKIVWVQLDYYERNPDMAKILYLTIPMKAWMSDESFKQKRFVNIFLEVLREGQEQGYLNPNVRTGLLLDVMFALAHRAFLMWIYRGQKERLTSQAGVLFDMMWRAISNPHTPK